MKRILTTEGTGYTEVHRGMFRGFKTNKRLYFPLCPSVSTLTSSVHRSVVMLSLAFSVFSQTGTVLDNESGAPLPNAVVSLKSTGALMLTDAEGKFEITGSAITLKQKAPLSHSVTVKNNMISFTVDKASTPVSIRLYTANGRMVAAVAGKNYPVGQHTLRLPVQGNNLYLLNLTIGTQEYTARVMTSLAFSSPSLSVSSSPSLPVSSSLSPDTLIVSKYHYTPATLEITGTDAVTIKLTKPSTQPPPPGMKSIPAGRFIMGATAQGKYEQNEIPWHEVTLSAFYMDSTEVTQADYALLMGIEPWTEHVETNPGKKYPGAGNYLPAWYLTWDDAVLYCNARSRRDGLDTVYSYSGLTSGVYGSNSLLADVVIDYTKKGYRLPTEAEWEYAARAGTRMQYYWSDVAADSIASKYARYASDGPLPVASLLPNDFGLYDILGNASEVINDFYGYYSDESVTDPVGPLEGGERCKRGGGWSDKIANHCRVARRLGVSPRDVVIHQGIRVVVSNQ